MAMLEDLQNKLKSAVNFPSPPAVAQQIIELASDPDIDIVKVAATISRDPGLTAKVLRVANSPLYCKRRKSDNLRQATVVLGLNAVTTLALSFSQILSHLERAAPEQSQSELPLGARGPPAQSSLL